MSAAHQDNESLAGEVEAIEAHVDAAIAACGGDPRATIKALLVANAYLENQVEQLVGQASAGYIRAGRRKPNT